ncbi:MAG: M20/M25/M40 family metallo-hydrolase [Anaerolineae bacterium]
MISQERLVNTFIELVTIDSPSGGEKQAAEYVANRLRTLGLEPQIDGMYNVTAVLAGKGKPLFLNAHTDRVEPARGVKPVIEAGRIKSDGTTVLGADDAAGVAAILEAVQSLIEDQVQHLPLEIAITAQEEQGLVGAKGLDLSGFYAKEGIVLDGQGPVGEITLGSPTQNQIMATITGKAAHSGTAPEEGIDAIRIAAKAISKLRLGRIDKETTANIGTIHGGTARNIVPEKVQVVGETRSRNTQKAERLARAMKQAFELAATPLAAKVDFQITRAYNQYRLERSDKVVKRLATAIKKIGRKPGYALSGGGSDANIFNAKRMKCVVTSVGYEQIHTTSEYIPIAELVKTAELVVALATE